MYRNEPLVSAEQLRFKASLSHLYAYLLASMRPLPESLIRQHLAA
jgi:hypothetical protein